jgi:hypothetical protein
MKVTGGEGGNILTYSAIVRGLTGVQSWSAIALGTHRFDRAHLHSHSVPIGHIERPDHVAKIDDSMHHVGF